MSDIQDAKNKCFHYANEHGTEALIAYLWLRIETLERELVKTNNRAASDALAASYSRGGGHGF